MIGIMLAAGRGTRMKSERPKVLFEINDEPLCFGPLRALMGLCETVLVVVGYKGEDVKKALLARAAEVFTEKEIKSKIQFITQDPPKGTGDAVKIALKSLGKLPNGEAEEVLVLNGDLPLIRHATLNRMIKRCRDEKLSSACLSMRVAQPKGLGRILRDETGSFTGIREEKDATAEERRINEINGGVYFFLLSHLKAHIGMLDSKNAQGEFYLTDLLGSRNRKIRSAAIQLRAPLDLMGVNTTFELASARRIAQYRLQRIWAETHGVDFKDPSTAYISARTQIEGACEIGPNVVVRGRSILQAGVRLDGNNFISDSRIESDAHVLWGSVINESRVGPRSSIGPMAHLRPGSDLESDVKIGNFVELKKTNMKKGSKASHLSYLGDAVIGEESNIGCGTITCNYDGFAKHATIIGRRAFIGSDTQLIAPVHVGDEAYVGSGTTVTQDVPAGALALSRTDMLIKEGYAKKLSEKLLKQRKAK